jgi:N-acyl homoserine lactone hydrolase
MTTDAAPRLYAFPTGGDVCDLAIYDPFDPDVGTKVYEPWFFYVITHPRGTVLFDAGVHPEMIKDPASRLGSWVDQLEMRMEPGDDAISQLGSIGLTPQDVDVVVLSHMHFDHVSALELYRHARIVVQRAEFAFAHNPPVYQAGTYRSADFTGEYNWDLIDGPLDLFEDGVLELVPTPGHTAGHQSMLVRLADSRVLLLGDVTYQLRKMRDRLLPAVVWSPDAMVQSWELVEWLAKREDALLVCSHDQDFRERMKLAPEAWYE